MKAFEYITVTGNLPYPDMEIADVQAFIRLAQILDASCIFVTMEAQKEKQVLPASFYFLDDRTLYKLKAAGYRTLDDYADASRLFFPDSESWYDAKKTGFTSFKEYDECRKAGTTDKSAYAKAIRLGFIEHYNSFCEKYEKQKQTAPKNFNREECTSALQLMEHAAALGFKDYADFDKAFFLGFNNQAEWDDAKKKGFANAAEYRDAAGMGITTPKEYHEAKHNGIATKQEYDKFIFLKRAAHNRYSFDQAHLINALKMYENGKKLPLKKLRELLHSQQEGYMIKNDNRESSLPSWYTVRLNTDDDYKSLLLNNAELSNHGMFDEEGEYYEVKRILDNKIFIDGANVAHGGINRDEHAKPKLSNILVIAQELKKMRFKDIVVISDASLRHRVIDKNIYDQLKKEVTYLESPAATSADEFLIECAKKEKCYIVSNDTFRDWKRKDPWIAENIDRLRIPFMIVQGKATLSIEDIHEKTAS
ncbi:MAG TPA: hypothetical protein VI757_08630 [Bacteroidia bacterium]|nr:hypothetical protein [Bacteroidia bacterium]